MESLLEQWRRFFEEQRSGIVPTLEYDYERVMAMDLPMFPRTGMWGPRVAARERIREERLALKNRIVDALTFWKFVIEQLQGKTWEERTEFLSAFTIHENRLIEVVAMVESFPTEVWRRVLWKHNIDFTTFEAFLRRITDDQIKGIGKNYEGLIIRKEMPPAIGIWRAAFRQLSVADLFSEKLEDGYEERYASKGAMSYNLFGIDFGFNAFPDGPTNDTKIVEISPLRFLSEKNHADDFVVDTEFGLYWRMYKFARSNYVWCRNKVVELSTHVCPGFWKTMIFHFFFWIVSPALCAGILSVIIHGGVKAFMLGAIWKILLIVPAAVTPLWVFIASMKYVVLSSLTEAMADTLGDLADGISSLWERSQNIRKYALCTIAVIILIAVAAIIAGFLWFAYSLLQLGMGTFGAIVAISGVVAYIVAIVNYGGYDELGSFTDDFPRWLQIPVGFSAGLVIYHGGHIYGVPVGRFLMRLCGDIALWLGHWLERILAWVTGSMTEMYAAVMQAVTFLGVFAVVLLLPIILMSVLVLIPLILSEEWRERISRYVERVMMWGCFAFFGIGICFIFAKTPVPQGFSSWVFTGIMFAVGVTCIIGWRLAFVKNPAVKAYQEATGSLNANRNWLSKIDYAPFRKNIWINSLPISDRSNAMYRIVDLIGDIVGNKMLDGACAIVIPLMTEDMFRRLCDMKSKLRYQCDDKRMEIFEKIVKHNMSFEEAYELVYAEEIAFKKRMDKILGFCKKLVYPATALGGGIMWLFKKAWEYAITAKRIWELFNKRCPYVTRSRVLQIGE